MTSFVTLGSAQSTTSHQFSDLVNADQESHSALLQGEILLNTQPYSAWGGAVTAQMYLPIGRSQVWQQLTDYPRWVNYFPDMIRSEVISCSDGLAKGGKRLYQVARKAFFLFTAQVEVHLHVVESAHSSTRQQIRFLMEKGSFTDFSADLKLQDYNHGTLLTYSVKATPMIPVPTALIQQAMRLDLPDNMRRMRQVICEG